MEKQKTNKTPAVIGSVLFVMVGTLFSGYVFWQHWNLDQSLARLELSITNQQAQIEAINEKDQVAQKSQKLQLMADLESRQIQWSAVALDIFKTFLAVPGLNLTNLSSSDEGHFYVDIEALDIEAFDALIVQVRAHEKMENGFLPSISQEVADSGQTLYRGQFNFDYQLD